MIEIIHFNCVMFLTVEIVMKSRLFLLLLILFTTPVFANIFGSGADMDKLIAISTVLSSPENYLDKSITVKGAIVSVCSKRGCWMKLASDRKFQTLRIKVNEGDMVFPLTATEKAGFSLQSPQLRTLHN